VTPLDREGNSPWSAQITDATDKGSGFRTVKDRDSGFKLK
jgi:hypothetical protein